MAIISNAVTIADAGAFSTSLGSMTLIKTLTASSSNTLSFVHGASSVVLDGTYPIYKFEFINCHPASNNVHFEFNMSTDSGSNYNVNKTTTFFQAELSEANGGAQINYDGDDDLAQSGDFQHISDAVGNDNDANTNGYLTIFNPSSTTFVKHFIATTNFSSQNEYSINDYIGGYANTTSAVDAIQFKMSSGNIDAGTIKMYGIKDS